MKYYLTTVLGGKLCYLTSKDQWLEEEDIREDDTLISADTELELLRMLAQMSNVQVKKK